VLGGVALAARLRRRPAAGEDAPRLLAGAMTALLVWTFDGRRRDSRDRLRAVSVARPEGDSPEAGRGSLDRARGAGAVLDLPMRLTGWGTVRTTGHDLFLAAFHRRAVAACDNSWTTPGRDEVGALAARLPEAHAANALSALGFRTVVVHGEFLGSGALDELRQRLAWLSPADVRLVPLGEADGHAV
jgi:hypothetical protein